MSLQSILQNSARALDVFSTAIEITGHNVANAGTEGYVREEMILQTATPYRKGGLVVGTGVDGVGVRQQIDTFLEGRLYVSNGEASGASVRSEAYLQIEAELRELTEGDVSTALSEFFNALDSLSVQPGDGPLRTAAIAEAGQLVETITGLRVRLDRLGDGQEKTVATLVSEANELVGRIDDLNGQISQLEANGLYESDAGSLRTQRYDALNRLSELVPIRYTEQTDGSVSVFSGDSFLILGSDVQTLESVTRVAGEVVRTDYQFSGTGRGFESADGEIGAHLNARDQILGEAIAGLDQFTTELIRSVNRIHTSGEGLSGWTEFRSETRVADSSLEIDSVGYPFDIEHGGFDLKVRDTTTGDVSTTRIAIDRDGIGTDSTLDSVVTAINAVDGVSASLNSVGELEILAESGTELLTGNDTSGFLAAVGWNTFFTGTDSGSIGVNPSILANHDLLATGRGGGPGDNTNLLGIAELSNDPQSELSGKSLGDFYAGFVNDIAQNAANETLLAKSQETFRFTLISQREQRSGVNIDEETVNLLTFQRNYQASARVMQTANELLETLLNIG